MEQRRRRKRAEEPLVDVARAAPAVPRESLARRRTRRAANAARTRRRSRTLMSADLEARRRASFSLRFCFADFPPSSKSSIAVGTIARGASRRAEMLRYPPRTPRGCASGTLEPQRVILVQSPSWADLPASSPSDARRAACRSGGGACGRSARDRLRGRRRGDPYQPKHHGVARTERRSLFREEVKHDVDAVRDASENDRRRRAALRGWRLDAARIGDHRRRLRYASRFLVSSSSAR